jgi:hypothetical protein
MRRRELIAVLVLSSLPALALAQSGKVYRIGVLEAIDRDTNVYFKDLPVQQPDKFELVANNRATGALNIRIPEAIRLRVDEFVE